MKLSELKYGETASITRLSDQCRGEARRRLLDLGFVRGTIITVQNISPLGNPIAYSLRDTLIALRKEQADEVFVEREVLKNE